VAARAADVQLVNLGFGGSALLDPFTARAMREVDADLVSIKVGINLVNTDLMRLRAFGPAVHGFLDTVRDGHPTTPIAVVTPIICPEAEDHPGPTTLGGDSRFHVVPRPAELATGALTLGRIRTLMAEVVQSRQAAGDDNLHLVDGLALFGTADLDDLPDGLHPNATGYRRMGERFHDLVFAMSGPFAPSN